MKIFTALFLAAVLPAAAQTPQVPHKMEFAGMTLIIHASAREEIQKDVDAMTKSPKHYNIKVERAKSYFPIIEKVFAEEQLPDDFKYLALQESALIADAVSTSNAVGFWQFKDFTAIEMGLRVDRDVDERQNIVSASRAAARYIKKNNTFFNNWIYALQAYQMGAGGVMRSVKDTQSGASRMEIDRDTYWYVKKYLAHKIAYEPAMVGKPQVEIVTYENRSGKPLKKIAEEVGVNETDLLAYNKWTRDGKVPADRTYVVAIPVIGPINPNKIETAVAKNDNQVFDGGFPKSQVVKKRINGIQAILASNESPASLAERGGISLSKFLKWNDLESNAKINAGQYYFLGKKRGRAEENFHKVTGSEGLWQISQQYGVQLQKLMKYNRLKRGDVVHAGQMLYLASIRPKDETLTVSQPLALNEQEAFNWDVQPESTTVEISTPLISSMPLIRDTVVSTPTNLQTDSALSPEILQDKTIAETVADSKNSAEIITVSPNETKLRSEHTVLAKETLYSIAKLYDVGVMDLVKWNNLDLQQGIKIGQVLKVTGNHVVANPVANATTLRETLHEVKSSDTLYSIARLYGVTIKDLMDWNGKKDFSLTVGEKLKIQQR